MRVLAILYCYPPLLVPASICYLKVVAALRARGVDVEILTITPDSFDSPGRIPLDPSLSTVIPDGVAHHSVRSPETRFLVKAIKRLDRRRRFTYRWLEPKKREWLGPARRFLATQDLDRFDVVLSCSQPHANHLLGQEIAREAGLPWVAYFSDPWTDSPYQTFGSDAVRAFHLELEDSIHRDADRVLFTCEEMREMVVGRHAALSNEKTGVLPHAFVSDWYPPREPRGEGGVFRILQTGSFYGPRTPEPLIEALLAIGSPHELVGRVKIESYGGMDPRHRQRIVAEGLEEVFVTHGFIPYLETLQLMRSHDALILIDAPLTSTDESVFLPSKLVDYLGSGTPVIAVTPEHGATARVVREAGGRICALERPAELQGVLADIIRGGGVETSPLAEGIAPFELRAVGSSLVDTLQAAIDDRSGSVR